MTLQSAIEAELPYLRSEALARMTSRVTIRRKTGQTVQNEDTGREDPEWDVVYADLPFRLGGTSRGDAPSRLVEVADIDREVASRVGNLPHDADDLKDGDYIDITTGENAGLVLEVVKATWQDQATARRVPVRTADRPEEW